MTEAKGYFSLIQFCPNRSRMETVNVGVILFCPALGFLDAAIAADARRMKPLIRDDFDKKAIDAALASMETRVRVMRDEIATKEDLTRFIETRANDFILTLPRAMRVTDPEVDLESLREELVERPTAPRAFVPDFSKVDAITQRPGLVDKLFRPKIIVPEKQAQFPVRFAYQNGAVNLVRTIAFSADPKRADERANEIAVHTRFLQHHPPNNWEAVNVILIPGIRAQNPSDVSQIPASIEATMREFNIRMVPLDEVEEFANEVEREAHMPGT